MSSRIWLVHDCLSHVPWLEFRGSPHDHAECRRLAAALYEARDAFRAATFDGSFGAAVAAELAWSAREAEWRPT